jgi:hypothetical protein
MALIYLMIVPNILPEPTNHTYVVNCKTNGGDITSIAHDKNKPYTFIKSNEARVIKDANFKPMERMFDIEIPKQSIVTIELEVTLMTGSNVTAHNAFIIDPKDSRDTESIYDWPEFEDEF